MTNYQDRIIEELLAMNTRLGQEAADLIKRHSQELEFWKSAQEVRQQQEDIWRRCSLAMYRNRWGDSS